MQSGIDFTKCKVLSGSMLKTIALLTMLIDHTAFALLRDVSINIITIGTHTLSLYTLMRMIGRLAFPIYCFLLVEGYRHTKSFRKYALNLFIFALIAEIPWNLIHVNSLIYIHSQNVFFTLFLGLVGIYAVDTIDVLWKKATALIALLLVSILLHADYGCGGFSFIVLLYLLKDNCLYQAIAGAGILGQYAACAFIPISLYNGKRGYIKGYSKYIFYILYPAHMMVLWYLRFHCKLW